MLAVMLACISSAGVVGFASIRAPAVIVSNNTGSLTTITLTITNGNGNVVFTNASTVANSTLQSAYIAAQYGSLYSGKNFSKYNFTYSIYDRGSNVSGPSAGAAMTLLAISAFENKAFRKNFTITGTISQDGVVGQVGGVLDKVSAAYANNLGLVLVPWATPGTIEQGIYYIAQTEYKIPVVEVANIPQAAGYAFGNASFSANTVGINFSNNYKIGALKASLLNCSNLCNDSPFEAFTNYTISLTNAQIANLTASLPGFSVAAGQLANISSQASALHQKGYLYIAADIDFLNYLDAFYLGSYNMTRTGALGYMDGIQSSCSNLLAPQLTLNNYEYVISAQLRQGWANYTINSTISGYNVSGANRDDIVSSMYSAGEAKAWCGAVSFLYGYPYSGNGAPVTFSQSLAQTAIQRINRAEAYPGMYLTLARQAYKQGNYPVAILDADYAYSLSSSSQSFGTNSTALIDKSMGLASNATYGAWATEFAKESLFYAYESSTANSSQLAQYYAEQSYTSAALAAQVSNDTKSIYSSLVAAPQGSSSVPSGPASNSTYGPDTVYMLDNLATQVQQLTEIVGITLALLVGCIVLVAVLAHKLMVMSAGMKKGGRKGK
jgi:predicted S18 family serine protease